MSGDPSVGEDVVMNNIVELTGKVNLTEPTIVDDVEVIVAKNETLNELENHTLINQSNEIHAAEVTVTKSCPVHKESKLIERIPGTAEINSFNGYRAHLFDKNLPDEYSQQIQLSETPESIDMGLKFETQEIINCPGQETSVSTFPHSISEEKTIEAMSHEQALHGNNEEVVADLQSSVASPVAVEDTRSFSSPSSQSQGDPSSNNLPHHPAYHSRGEMFIPSDRVGVVIGARGANINEVMRRTGCRIQIQQENLLDDRERLVVFDGSPSQIRDARLLINGLSVDGPSVLESGGAGGVSSSHSSDRGDRDDRERGRRGGGSNLGNNGNYNNSNSNHINNSHSGGNHNGGGAHHHIGNSAGQQQQQFSTYNGEPPALEEDIDPQMVRVVIGVKGITVTSIARKSGARILMNQRFPVGHPHKIQYWGSQAQIEVARHLVTTLLNYGPEALQQEINGHGSSAGGERSDSGRSDRHGDSRGDRGDRDNRGDRAENNRGERSSESTVTLQDVKVFQSQMVRLLGPHGNNVNEVQGRYGVKISIDTTPQLAPVNNLGPSGFPEATNKVTVSGPAGAVQLAVKQLHELIDVHGEAPQPPPQQNQPTPQHGQQQPPQQQQQSVSANSGASGGYPSHGGSARNQPPQQHNQHHGGQQGHSGNSYGSGFAITPVIHQSPQPRPSAPLGFNPTMTNPGAAQQAHPGQMPLVQQRVMPPQQQVAGFAQQQQQFQQPQMVAAMNSAGFMGMPSPTQQPLVMGGVMPMQQPQQMHGQNQQQQQQQQPQQLQQQGQFAPQQFANPQQQMLAAQQAQQRPPEGAQQLPDGTYQQIAEISNAVVGRLQGRNNVTLGLIRNKSGALVQLGASDMVRGVTRIVLIGSPQTVALASQMVQEVLVNGAGKLHQLLDVPGSAMQPATANTPEMVPPGMVVQQTAGGMPMMMQQPSLVPMGAQQQFLSGPQMVPHFAASQQQQLQPPQQPGGGMLVMQPNGMVFPIPNSNVPGMQQQQQQLAHQQVAQQQQQQQLAQHSQQMHFPQQPNMPQQFPPQMPPQQQHLAQPGLQQMQFAAGLQQQQHALQGVQGANGMPGAMFMASQLHQQPMGGPAAGMPVPAMGFVNGQPHQHLQQQHQQSFALQQQLLQQQHQQTMQFAQHQQQHDRIQQQYGPGQGAYPHMQQAQSPHHQQQQRLQQQQQQQQRAPPGNNNFNNNRRY